MKDIRKYITGLAAASFVMAAAVPGHASFLSKGTSSPITASATIGGTPTIAISGVQVLDLSNGAVSSGGLGWSGLTAGYATNGGWKVSDQYIQLTANINTTSGGIQFYTDNTNATSANPKFTGPNNGVGNNPTPAGLVDTADTTKVLPTAWRASTNTYAVGAAQLAPINPNDPNGFNWFYNEDAKQVANTTLGAAAFQNGSSYVTTYAAPSTSLTDGEVVPANGGGVHFASGLDPATNLPQFGPFAVGTSVTNIYVEGNFSQTLAGRTYTTNRLILEAFSI